MAACALLMFTLLMCACVHTVVECDLSCSNMQECTMYTIKEVGRKVDNMQSNMAAIVNQLTQIQDADIALEKVLQRLEIMNDTILRQNLEISGLQEQITNLNHVDQINDKLSGTFVSFTAYATIERSYNKRDRVLFDGIVRNYGSSYFEQNSTFICPFDAYYLFSSSILVSTTFEFDMMLNDEKLVSPFSRSAAASNMVVTQCRAGQMLWIEAGRSGRLGGNIDWIRQCYQNPLPEPYIFEILENFESN